jgi:capsular exopolysaccharide synthesis family protein
VQPKTVSYAGESRRPEKALSTHNGGNIVELREYLRLLRRRWLLIAGTLTVTLVLAGVLTYRATPQYASDARVFISTSASSDQNSSDNAYQGGLAATQRVKSYASLVSDGELAQRVVTSMDLGISAKELSRHLTAEVVPDTVLLKIQVTDAKARQARAICRQVVKQLLVLINEIETPPGQATALLKGTVVGPASLEATPISPKPLRNLLLAAVLGFLLGLALAVARELLDSSVTSIAEVEELLDAPMLAGIAFDADTAKEPLVTSLRSHAPRAEAFRVLRTNLQFVDVASRSKVFVVTSSVPGEGKSTTAVNVAITMAQGGQRVLLVDGDLRRPQVAEMLGLEREVGVTTVLLGRIGLDEAIQNHHASGLDVLTSGSVPPNPAELLQSPAMGELLALLREDYDTVIIDSPPLLPVTDAAVLAQQTDGAVIVVRHGRTTREQLAGAQARLHAVDAKVLGAVLNRVRTTRSGYGYGYGYGYAPDGQHPRRAEHDLAPEASQVGSRVADVLPITGKGARPRTTAEGGSAPTASQTSRAAQKAGSRDRTLRRPRGASAERSRSKSRRAIGRALTLTPSDLPDTGTTAGNPPGRHRS